MSNFDLCAYLGRDKAHLFQKLLPLENIKDTSKLSFPMWISEKFDGVFCCAVQRPDGSIGFYSRTGEEYLSMEHLKAGFKDFFYDEHLEFICFEAYIPERPQAEISGAVRDTKQQHKELHALLLYYVYDTGDCEVFYHRATDCRVCSLAPYQIYPHIHIVPHYYCFTLEDALRVAKDVWEGEGEGVVLSERYSKYFPGKRNTSMIKIKQTLSFDLEVINCYEGKGKYAGTLGGLICRWKDGKTIRISGMTDEQRSAWWTDPKAILGKIVQVDAMGYSSKGLLREPRFKGVRYDKEEGDF